MIYTQCLFHTKPPNELCKFEVKKRRSHLFKTVEYSAPSQGIMKTGIAFFSRKIVFPKQSFSKLRKRKRAEKQNSTFSAFFAAFLPVRRYNSRVNGGSLFTNEHPS
ncbi:hypothetical protein CEXT_59621 [Caerostris extrusa]|uniref:Uncharacterized protein n=1 Tax=Caerostris extrusa TaxID=172846 RepID=A0AAV4QQC6_CAEEX|nr:hypothetical protein CEXT_59621 [Caerostris extrusa]